MNDEHMAIDSLYEQIMDMVEDLNYALIPQPFEKGLAIVEKDSMNMYLIVIKSAKIEVI